MRVRAYPRGYKGIYTPKLSRLELTTDAEYVANLVNVNIVVNVQHAVFYRPMGCYTCITTFFADIIGCDRLKFS